MSRRQQIQKSRRWVVKIGSALLTDDGRGLDVEAINVWVTQVAALVKKGYEVVMVSSGAVAAGVTRLGWESRPREINKLQAAAAVGQSSLVRAYEDAFQRFNLKTAQVLLDHDDLSNRQRYLNARSTLKTLFGLGVVAIVNENDTVVTEEIRFGDNDTLGALVANLIEADTLCILTDQNGMYESDPRKNALAKMVIERPALDGELDDMAGSGGALGRGGMSSKVRAARLAARSGASTIIVGGRIPEVIPRVTNGEILGTLLYASQPPLAARKQWLAGNMQARGALVLDDGAVRVLKEQGRSLLPVGVVEVSGHFLLGDMVVCHDQSGVEVARGLVSYNSDDARKVIGKASAAIEMAIGYQGQDELIHRDNLVLM